MSTSSVGIATSLGVSSPGIGSGLDVTGIISKLMAVESQPITLLNAQEASYQAQLTAYGTLSGALSSFQSSLGSLTNAATFQSLSATPADTTLLTASASPGATLGNYAVTVNALAQSQSLTATGQTSSLAAIGTGASTTLSFSFGTISGGTLTNGVYTGATYTQDPTQPTKTITIDSTNNSLQGIRDAINAANIGVSASIVNDGSATPYRLQLTSISGASHSMSISVSGDATLGSLLSYNPAGTQNLNQSLAAQNASLTVNGLAITSASNTVSSAIPNTTLNLLKTGTTAMSVSNNTSGIQSAVQSFVTAYNSLNSSFASLTSYNASTQQAGLLNGDVTTMMIQNRLREALTQPIAGLANTSITNLSQLGISVNQSDGSLVLDTNTLQNAIANNSSDIAGLFASVGKTTDSLVNYVSSGTSTQPGTYAVNVTQLATQGNVAGNVNLSGGITINGTNNVLNLTLDGNSQAVTLAQGTYSSAQLAALVQATINGTSAYSSAGSSVSVSINGSTGFMSITSGKYGSASNVSVTNTSAGTALLGGTGTSTAGADVAGSINGVTAAGSGQYLSGASGTAVDGLKIQINGGSLGSRGNISFSQGYATTLNNLLSSYTSPNSIISAATSGINSNITSINNQITAMNQYLAQVQKNYQTQFTALDVMMGQMQNTTNYLTQQLTQMSYTYKNYG